MCGFRVFDKYFPLPLIPSPNVKWSTLWMAYLEYKVRQNTLIVYLFGTLNQVMMQFLIKTASHYYGALSQISIRRKCETTFALSCNSCNLPAIGFASFRSHSPLLWHVCTFKSAYQVWEINEPYLYGNRLDKLNKPPYFSSDLRMVSF